MPTDTAIKRNSYALCIQLYNMPRGKDISANKASEIKALLEHTSMSQREIARRFSLSVSTVNKIAHDDNPTESRRKGRCGRKKKLSNTDERSLILEVKRNPRTTLPKLQQRLADAGTNVHQSTISRRLKEFKCKNVKPRKVPLLTTAMKKKRLAFAMEHRNWSAEDWEKVGYFYISFYNQYNICILFKNIKFKQHAAVFISCKYCIIIKSSLIIPPGRLQWWVHLWMCQFVSKKSLEQSRSS